MTKPKPDGIKRIVPRIPDPCGDVQVSFCKNPECKNYGVPASADYHHPNAGGKYRRGGGGARSTGIICQECGQCNPLKSNSEIVAEAARLGANIFEPPAEPFCPDESCPNHGVPVSVGKKAYVRFGHTPLGSLRYICKGCGEKFSVALKSTHWQKRIDKNERIFMDLVNHSAYKRIIEEDKTGGGALYGKIDFFYEQCRLFAGEMERRLVDGTQLGFHRLYLSTDSQEYMTNWRFHEARMNVKLSAVGTADNDSGFVFGMHLNYDPIAEQAKAEEEAKPDAAKPEPFRLHARYWLTEDYLASIKRSNKRAKRRVRATRRVPTSPMERIRMEAKASGHRFNVESKDEMNPDLRLPEEGMLVQKDYSAYGHFFFLKKLFGENYSKLRFFFDYDSGLRGACHAAFCPEIKARRVDTAYVTLTYGLTKPAKLAVLGAAKKAFLKTQAEHPELSEHEVKTLLMIQQMEKKESDLFWGDWWMKHPLPDMNEPQKMISFQTNIGEDRFDSRHLANLMKKASLHGINRFFNLVRRRLQALDRTVGSASTQRREYLLYGPYNPVYAWKVLEILRVYYNYILPVKEHHGVFVRKADRKTPAQYLGLADRTYSIDDVLNFMPTPVAPKQPVAIPA